MPPENAKERLRELIAFRAVEVKEEGFVLASGRTSKIYIDLRGLTQDAEGINLIGRLVLDKVEELVPEASCVGGPETGAIPIATAVALLSYQRPRRIQAFWVRKRSKDHGLQNLIERNLERGATAVILDDTVTTGESSFRAAEAVRKFGATVAQAIAIVDRGARENFASAGIPYFAFFTESDLCTL